jgi:hypothetical protein
VRKCKGELTSLRIEVVEVCWRVKSEIEKVELLSQRFPAHPAVFSWEEASKAHADNVTRPEFDTNQSSHNVLSLALGFFE